MLDNEVGTVKFFNKSKGYGFLLVPNGSRTEEIFFHLSGLRTIEPGAREGDLPHFGNVPDDVNEYVPREGECIVFRRIIGARGPYAKVWGCGDRWERLLPPPPTPRAAAIKIAKALGAKVELGPRSVVA